MKTINELRRISSQSPTQWEGETEDGTEVYIRYRWGKLEMRVGEETYTIGKNIDPDNGQGMRTDTMERMVNECEHVDVKIANIV